MHERWFFFVQLVRLCEAEPYTVAIQGHLMNRAQSAKMNLVASECNWLGYAKQNLVASECNWLGYDQSHWRSIYEGTKGNK